MALETSGVPTVAVHTHVFERLARSVARQLWRELGGARSDEDEGEGDLDE